MNGNVNVKFAMTQYHHKVVECGRFNGIIRFRVVSREPPIVDAEVSRAPMIHQIAKINDKDTMCFEFHSALGNRHCHHTFHDLLSFIAKEIQLTLPTNDSRSKSLLLSLLLHFAT